jgi:hypothetical protein
VPNRREFLAISLASSALPIVAGERREGASCLENSNIERVRSGAVIVEMTSPLALAFRAEAVKLGLPAHGIHDDITDLWYHHLDRQWSTAPGTLAGITLSTSLFCLETFARDYGMRVWFRAIHKNRPDGRTGYVLSGDEPLVEQAAALYGECDGGWAAAFARFTTAVPLAKSGKFQQKIMETAALLDEEPGPMVSWIIAPRLREQSGPIS